MKIPYFEVAAFTQAHFAGNPAGVCVLEEWLPDALLQSIATENNLAETAFLVPHNEGYELRWHTPTVEVNLCGHATLAAAHVVFQHLGFTGAQLSFDSPRSGNLNVSRAGDRLVLDFPAHALVPCETPNELSEALGRTPKSVWEGRDYFAVFDHENEVVALQPDFALLRKLAHDGVVVTAPGSDCDFVSRFFAPKLGIDEDPVTGSTHCSLIPFWAGRLGKKTLRARQLSRRGGELFGEERSERVAIGGHAVTYLTGQIDVP